MRLVRFERAAWARPGEDPGDDDWGPAYVNPDMVVFIDGAADGSDLARLGVAHADNLLWIAKRFNEVAVKLSDERIGAGG